MYGNCHNILPNFFGIQIFSQASEQACKFVLEQKKGYKIGTRSYFGSEKSKHTEKYNIPN